MIISTVNGQIYTGTSLNKLKDYSCSLKINSDSSVLFIYHTELNETYGEHSGRISKINDTLYQVSASLTFGKFDVMRLYTVNTFTNKVNDTDYLCIKPIFDKLLAPIVIEYLSGKTVDYKYSESGCFALDKKLFNQSKSSNYYLLQSSMIDKISRNKLVFKVRFGSSPSFESGETTNFKIVIKDNLVNGFILQTGQFRLKKSGT